MNQEEVKGYLNDTGESAFELLHETDQKLIRKFYSIDKQLIKLLSDVRQHFPDAEFYTDSGGFNLLLGESHGSRGESQQELIACCGKASIGDGGF